MGAVCTKSLKQSKLENTPVITTRFVFIFFFLKRSTFTLISQLKTSFLFSDIYLLVRSLMNALWVYLFPPGCQLILTAEQMKTRPCHQARLFLVIVHPQAPGFPRQLQRALSSSSPNYRLDIGESCVETWSNA